jgi:hypothetical protein
MKVTKPKRERPNRLQETYIYCSKLTRERVKSMAVARTLTIGACLDDIVFEAYFDFVQAGLDEAAAEQENK